MEATPRQRDLGYARQQDNESTRQRVGRQPELWNYGVTESRIYGIMEASPIQRVVRSLPIANSQRPTDLSIHSIPKYYYITTLQKDIYRQTHSYLVKELINQHPFYKFCIYTYYMQTTILFQNSINLFPN